MKTKINWIDLGGAVALFVNIYTTVRKAFIELSVPLGELLEWVTGPGAAFSLEQIKAIGMEFLRINRPLRISARSIDLYTWPQSKVTGCTTVIHKMLMSNTRFEKWHDGTRIQTYRGAQKCTRRMTAVQLAPERIADTAKEPHYLQSLRRRIVAEKTSPNDEYDLANVCALDALFAEEAFIPEDWEGTQGEPRWYYCFFGTVFADNDEIGSDGVFYSMEYSRELRKWLKDTMRLSQLKANAHRIMIVRFEKEVEV